MIQKKFLKNLFKVWASIFFLFSTSIWSSPLLLYCSQDKSFVEPLVQEFQKQYKDCQIKVLYLSQHDLEKKLNQEFSTSESSADLIWVLHQKSLSPFKGDQRLLTFSLDQTPLLKNSYDPDHQYYGVRLTNLGLSYFSDQNPSLKITSWKDLQTEEVRGHLVLPLPGNSESLYFYTQLLKNFSEKWLQAILKNNPIFSQSLKESISLMGVGPTSCGIALDAHIIKENNEENRNFKFIYPEEGVIPFFDGVAIVKTTKNKEDSLNFLSFLLSEKIQKKVASMGYISVRPDVLTPLGYPTLQKIKFIEEFPLDKLSENTIKNIFKINIPSTQ